jgi:hypothetical protein
MGSTPVARRRIFILRAGETLVGGEELVPGQPTENIALERGSALPNLAT